MSSYRVAVVGATGAVGQEMLKVLERRNFPVSSLRCLASARSAGSALRFGDESVRVEELTAASFRGIDLALFSAGADRAREFAPLAVRAGAVVVDNSSAFRMQDDVPLVVPEVNRQHLQGHSGLIANPNCSTIQMVLVLKPIHTLFGLERVFVSTYQSVSGAGQRSMTELRQASEALLTSGNETRDLYPQGIAFNCVPHIDVFDETGRTREEVKMESESRKILDLSDLQVFATCVRVPVFRAHSEAVWALTRQPVDRPRLLRGLAQQEGLRTLPSESEYPTPRQAAEQDDVFVGRIRTSEDAPQQVTFWVVGDNLLKGAALNAVQIAECVCNVPASS